MPKARSLTKGMMGKARHGYTVLNYQDLVKNNNMYKKQNKGRLANRSIGYDMSRGFYYKDADYWTERTSIPKRAVKLANGRTVYVYDSGDRTGKFIPFSRMAEDKDLAKYIEETNLTWSVEGCGHIKQLDYSPRRCVMRVEFQEQTDPATGKTWGRADVAYFFNVPSAVYGELYYLAQSKTTSGLSKQGTPRHNLGIRFWDLVRIRGSLFGSRYPYSVTEVSGPNGWVGGARKVHAANAQRAQQEVASQGRTAKTAKQQEQIVSAGAKQKQASLSSNSTQYDKILKDNGVSVNMLDGYSDMLPKSDAKHYSTLTTPTDKYLYLVEKHVIDDWAGILNQ